MYGLIGEPPDDEVWAFSVGDLVRCQMRTFSGDEGQREPVLVAYESSRGQLRQFHEARRQSVSLKSA